MSLLYWQSVIGSGGAKQRETTIVYGQKKLYEQTNCRVRGPAAVTAI